MASMRDIKRRIKSVNSTRQITKAMNLVSAAKLQVAKRRLEETRPFFNETKRVIGSIVNNSKGVTQSLIQQRDVVKSTLIILISGDRGLCGGYNANVSKAALKLAEEKESVSMIVVGSKGADFFRNESKVQIVERYVSVSEKPHYETAAHIGREALKRYLNHDADEVYLVYTEFQSALSHEPKVSRILPVDTSDFANEEEKGISGQMLYDPGEEEVLDFVIPKYLNTNIFGAFLESAACEQGSMMTSMDSATENATDMIDRLTLLYNRARQGAITQEITEIVGGASALK